MRRLAIAALLLTGCGKEDSWRGFFYPDKTNLTDDLRGGPFKTIEQCRDWVDGERRRLQRDHDVDPRDTDYECGKNCKPPRSPDAAYVCEDTIR